jgi:hypothetical protein
MYFFGFSSIFLLGILILKFSLRNVLYKSFDVKGLIKQMTRFLIFER